MLGLWVEESTPYAQAQVNAFCTADGRRFECQLWSDVIRLRGAEPLAHYLHDYYDGNPAITRHRFGRGTCYYVGTAPERDGLDWVLKRAGDEANAQPAAPALPAGVECVRRRRGPQAWLFVLNHSAEKVAVTLDLPGQDLLTGAPPGAALELEPAGVAIVQLQP
jgi:beta-galactosidase